ncbi:hypothetical protein B5M45_27100 [Mycobacterium simiae]|uniref:Uncharacterized protein n=1 Tax=Mycobacterium simiae TaxID=1784 RepID=A0A1X0XN75_MYCSI|nr:hypothetical protein B5M45_27100 [Mycobacterium simiae]
MDLHDRSVSSNDLFALAIGFLGYQRSSTDNPGGRPLQGTVQMSRFDLLMPGRSLLRQAS